nr:MAG: capsid protein [Cressdnaviricota sp.]
MARKGYRRRAASSYRRRTIAKRTFKMSRRMGRPLLPRVFSCKRSFQGAVITSSVSANVATTFTFKLSDVPNAADFTNLFDQYRIVAVKCRFYPQSNSFNAVISGTPNYSGMFYYTIDHDDSGTLSSLAAALEYNSCKMTNVYHPISVFFRPKIASTAIDSSAAVQPALIGGRSPWLDCDYNNIQHYALKTIWGQSIGLITNMLPVFTYYMQFKDPK